MDIQYKTKKLRVICTSAYEARKKYGEEMADIIQQRIQEIGSADTVAVMVKYRIGRCHKLKGNRSGQYAVDLIQPHRLVFTVEKETVEIAIIEEIVKDYH